MIFDFDERASAVDRVHFATAIFTAAAVVDDLLQLIGWPDRDGRLVDPSAGDGSFLERALMRLSLPLGDMEAINRVQGWELHPGAVVDARERIASLLRTRG